MFPPAGKLLTSEQSVRLALLETVEKQRVIEEIAKGLHDVGRKGNGLPGGACPFNFYSRPISAD